MTLNLAKMAKILRYHTFSLLSQATSIVEGCGFLHNDLLNWTENFVRNVDSSCQFDPNVGLLTSPRFSRFA